jgi:hypothetical protein
MRTRSKRIRLLVVAIVILVFAAAGFFLTPVLMIASGMPGSGMTMALFRIAWVAVGLIGAGLALYNAFGRRSAVPYEIDGDVYTIESPTGSVCPKCGKPVGENDRFCRNCGAYLRA